MTFRPALTLVLTAATAGCMARPAANSPNGAIPEVAGEAASMDVAVDVALAAMAKDLGRKLQFVGGNGTTGSYNDVDKMVVGLFDEGSTVAPAFGYKYSAAYGTTLSASNVATVAGSSWLSDLQSRVDADSTADHSATRRFLVREFTSGMSGATTISVSFSKIPKTAQHTYRAFAAAYDADGNNIGYISGALSAVDVSANANFTATQLNLTLNSNLFTATLTQGATISNVYPEAL